MLKRSSIYCSIIQWLDCSIIPWLNRSSYSIIYQSISLFSSQSKRPTLECHSQAGIAIPQEWPRSTSCASACHRAGQTKTKGLYSAWVWHWILRAWNEHGTLDGSVWVQVEEEDIDNNKQQSVTQRHSPWTFEVLWNQTDSEPKSSLVPLCSWHLQLLSSLSGILSFNPFQ